MRLAALPLPLLAAAMGLAYLLGDPDRTSGPSFNAAQSVASMHTWGWMFLLGAVAMLLALAARSPRLIFATFLIGGATYTWWSALFALAALDHAGASATGWAIHAVIAFGHYLTAWRVRLA